MTELSSNYNQTGKSNNDADEHLDLEANVPVVFEEEEDNKCSEEEDFTEDTEDEREDEERMTTGQTDFSTVLRDLGLLPMDFSVVSSRRSTPTMQQENQEFPTTLKDPELSFSETTQAIEDPQTKRPSNASKMEAIIAPRYGLYWAMGSFALACVVAIVIVSLYLTGM